MAFNDEPEKSSAPSIKLVVSVFIIVALIIIAIILYTLVFTTLGSSSPCTASSGFSCSEFNLSSGNINGSLSQAHVVLKAPGNPISDFLGASSPNSFSSVSIDQGKTTVSGCTNINVDENYLVSNPGYIKINLLCSNEMPVINGTIVLSFYSGGLESNTTVNLNESWRNYEKVHTAQNSSGSAVEENTSSSGGQSSSGLFGGSSSAGSSGVSSSGGSSSGSGGSGEGISSGGGSSGGNTSPAPKCGNGVVESGELCDSNSISCSSINSTWNGTAICNSTCNGWNTATCTKPSGTSPVPPPAPKCGNGVVESGELCDSNSISCSSLNSSLTGTARCNSTCNGYNISSCVPVGNFTVAGNSLVIYDGSLNSSWIDSSWTATNNFSSKTQLYEGRSSSIKVNQGKWGALSFHNGDWNTRNEIDPTEYSCINIAIYPVSAMSLSVIFESSTGYRFSSYKYGQIPSGRWSNICVPLNKVDPTGNTFNRLDISNTNGSAVTFYVGYVTLEKNASTASPAPKCGNGVVESGELCDSNSISCSSINSTWNGTAICNSTCNGWNTATCTKPSGTSPVPPPAPKCGNGVVESGELCDSNSISCSSINSTWNGTAICNSTCNGWNTATCTKPVSLPPIINQTITNTSFVSVQNGKFYLDGKSFYFAGTNAYYLETYEKLNPSYVSQLFSDFVKYNITVIRMWAFYNGKDCGLGSSNDPVIQTAPGVYDESSLVDLDKVLNLARENHIKVIMTLSNYWDASGGICQYDKWAGIGSGSVDSGSLTNAQIQDFYTSQTTQTMYKNYVSMLLNRVNTQTGVAYKNDPTIMAWELMNEGANPAGKSNGTVMRNWYQEMATYIKSIDSHHLVDTGEEGFDENTPPQYSTNLSNTWVLRSGTGTSFIENTAIPEIDFASIHVYPDAFGFKSNTLSWTEDGLTYINDHAKIAASDGKPLVIGEYGSGWIGGYVPDGSNKTYLYEAWWANDEKNLNIAGDILWQFTTGVKCSESAGNICISRDPTLTTLLAAHGVKMIAKDALAPSVQTSSSSVSIIDIVINTAKQLLGIQ